MRHVNPGVNRGRYTAAVEGDFVVFLIGAKPSLLRPLRSLRDLGGRRGMQHMLKYLSHRPDRGLLGYERLGIGTWVQYWRSFAHLEAFARNSEDPHLEVWRRYTRRARKSARTGLWHEAYLVSAGRYEAVYTNMPTYGLARAGQVRPLQAHDHARHRLAKAETADPGPPASPGSDVTSGQGSRP